MNILATANAGGGFGVGAIAMYVVFIGAIFYFMAYRPNKKEKAKQAELFASLEVGDTVETASGFYGVLCKFGSWRYGRDCIRILWCVD